LYLVFIDESGTDSLPPKDKLTNKKKRFFVEACIIVNNRSMNFLEKKYYELLRSVYINGVSVSELFSFYKRLTSREPELKASYILDRKGPFRLLHEVSIDQYKRFRDQVFTRISKTLRDSQADIIAIVIDKYKLHDAINKHGIPYEPRSIAMDFLFTRIAIVLERKGYKEAAVIHDVSSKEDQILDVLEHLKKKGYYYNPHLKRKPNYNLIKQLTFIDSTSSIFLQYTDILANLIRRKHAYGEKQYYSILAGTPRFYTKVYPREI